MREREVKMTGEREREREREREGRGDGREGERGNNIEYKSIS